MLEPHFTLPPPFNYSRITTGLTFKALILLSSFIAIGHAWSKPNTAKSEATEIEQVKAQSKQLENDLSRFLKWFPGEYNNHEQVWLQKGVEEDVVFSHVHHIFASVEAQKVSAHVFYIEQRFVESGALFRQRLYTIKKSNDKRSLRLDIYKFKDEKKWSNLHTKPTKAHQLDMGDLIPMSGCEVYWSYDQEKQHFTGSMPKDKCRIVSKRSGKTMIISDDLILESNAIMIRDVARDEQGKVLFGYPDKPHYRNVKVRYYQGWAVVRPGGSKHDSEEGRWDINKNLHIHSEGGKLPLLGPNDIPTGYSIQLARVTRPSSKTEVLKMSVVDDTTEDTLAYTWTTPNSERIGLNLLWARIGLTLEKSTPHLGFDPPPEARSTSRTPPSPKPQVVQIKPPMLVVSNLDKSLKVYRDILGFKVLYIKKAKEVDSSKATQMAKEHDSFNFDRKQNAYSRFATLNTPNQERAFGLMELKGEAAKKERFMRSKTVIQVRDLQELREQLLKVDSKVSEIEVESKNNGRTYRELTFVDPDGHTIVLYDVQETVSNKDSAPEP